VYDLDSDLVLDQQADEVPFVDLDRSYYAHVSDFEQRFPQGAPSLREASSLRVEGDFTFGSKVKVVGDVELAAEGAERVENGAVLQGGEQSDA
jgi:UTP--glucose-1-phosphate uridylyltransferase